MICYEKDDGIDAAAIGDLLRRGEGTPFQPATGVYLQLQHLDRVRVSKMRTALQNQIIGHLDRIFPGLVLMDDEAKKRYTPLFSTDFLACQTLQHPIRVCPDPHKDDPQGLVDAFRAHNYRLGRSAPAKNHRLRQANPAVRPCKC